MNSIGSMHVCLSNWHLCNLYVTCLDELIRYSRSDLLKLRFHPECTKRLAGLESNESVTDVVLDKVSNIIQNSASQTVVGGPQLEIV